MIEKWNKKEDNRGVFGVLMTYLSKVFDCFTINFKAGHLWF